MSLNVYYSHRPPAVITGSSRAQAHRILASTLGLEPEEVEGVELTMPDLVLPTAVLFETDPDLNAYEALTPTELVEPPKDLPPLQNKDEAPAPRKAPARKRAAS